MPIGRDAEAQLANLTGLTLMRVKTTTRILRETSALSGYDYWLRAGRGIRDASVLPHHIINATLAMMVQPSEGPGLIDQVRRLELTSTTERIRSQTNLLLDTATYTEKQEPRNRIEPPASFGFLLDALLFALSGWRRADDTQLRAMILEHTPLVRIRLGASLSAEVVWATDNGAFELVDAFRAPAGTLLSGLSPLPAENGLFDRIIEISDQQFRNMAGIVGADTDQPLLMPPGANPETKTATPGPGKDTSAAALSDQSARTEPGTSQPHNMVEREKTQPTSEARGGRSRPFDRSVSHDRHRLEPRSHAA